MNKFFVLPPLTGATSLSFYVDSNQSVMYITIETVKILQKEFLTRAQPEIEILFEPFSQFQWLFILTGVWSKTCARLLKTPKDFIIDY